MIRRKDNDTFDIAKSRAARREQLRVADLMALTPSGGRILEIGARDCYFSRRLRGLYGEVVALDLTRPEIDEPGITPVQGDVTALGFADGSFDTVFCTEVLEHVPPALLAQACREITRVTKRYAVIGVPCRQDLRFGRLRCDRCGGINPPTGHLTVFDRDKLESLFPDMEAREVHRVGYGEGVTNPLSDAIFRLYGYPYGTYAQEEGCIHCGARMHRPHIGPAAKAACFVARGLNALQNKLCRWTGIRRPNWIHILFEKK